MSGGEVGVECVLFHFISCIFRKMLKLCRVYFEVVGYGLLVSF